MHVFFDLDGTLTDSMEGITRSVQHALRYFGIEEPDTERLRAYIGPPLKDSFRQFHGLSADEAEAALLRYRERYAEVGIFENRLYDGILELLQMLKGRGVTLAVTTSKPLLYTERILRHFGIDGYFDAVVGCHMNESNTGKAELVADTLSQLGADPADTFMVGDRRFDIEGAHQNGVRAIGVSYGFAPEGELQAAGADCIVDSVAALTEFLCNKGEETK